jgi:hypothetical protein
MSTSTVLPSKQPKKAKRPYRTFRFNLILQNQTAATHDNAQPQNERPLQLNVQQQHEPSLQNQNETLEHKKAFKFYASALLIFAGGSFAGAGMDCLVYKKSYFDSLMHGQLTNILGTLGMILGFLLIARYHNKQSIPWTMSIITLPLLSFVAGCAIAAHSIDPSQMWQAAGGELPAGMAIAIGGFFLGYLAYTISKQNKQNDTENQSSQVPTINQHS